MLPIAKLLGEKGIKFCFVCKSPDNNSFYLKNGFESFNIADHVFNSQVIIGDKEKENMDLKYGPPGIREMCVSDVHMQSFFGDNQEAKEQIMARALKFWENFFDKNKIDHLLLNETASFQARSAYLVAKKRNIPFFSVIAGPGNEIFCMVDVGETYAWKELIDSLNKKNNPISQKEKEAALNFVDKRISRKNKISVFFVSDSIFKSIKNLAGLWVRNNEMNKKKDPIFTAGLHYGIGQLWRRIKWNYFTKYFFKYDKPQSGEKYVYFPFFSGKETMYLSNEMFYSETENQISLIKEVARSLPYGYFLYAKEHPFNPGDFTFSSLKKLKKSPNIKVFHPSVSSQELIDGSSAVVTVEGTAGWEAFLSKKPVVCIGGLPYYSYSSLVYKVGNICDLSKILWQAIRNGAYIYKQNENEWIRFIHNIISTCGKGAIFEAGTPNLSTNYENLKNMADSIFKKITKNLANLKSVKHINQNKSTQYSGNENGPSCSVVAEERHHD
jgi:hypothetical protein